MSLRYRDLKNMKPGDRLPDPACHGLRYLATSSGIYAQFRWKDTTTEKWTSKGLGRLPSEDEAEAIAAEAGKTGIVNVLDLILEPVREKAQGIKKLLRSGVDPKINDKQKVSAVIDDWLERDQKDNRSYYDVKRVMEKEVKPRWGDRAITSISSREIGELLDAIVDRGAPVMARRTHAYLHRFLKWCSAPPRHRYLQSNPLQGAEKPAKGAEKARNRALSDEELARVWHAAQKLGYPYGSAAQMLILTGARCSEASLMPWEEVGEDEMFIPGERMKNGEAHIIPISSTLATFLAALPRINPKGKRKAVWLFTSSGRAPIANWSRAKRELDALAAALGPDGKPLAEAKPLPGWRIHDLRRTVATGLQRLHIPLEVTEAVLAHKGVSRTGIAGVYQVHDWRDEKRAALEAWGRAVMALAGGVAGNVVEFTRAERSS
jgi:integrase